MTVEILKSLHRVIPLSEPNDQIYRLEYSVILK